MPNAHQSLVQLLLGQGRIDEGMAHMRKTCELDPMAPIVNTLEASYLTELGRFEQARLRLGRALDIAPRGRAGREQLTPAGGAGRAILEQMKAKARVRFVPPTSLAAVHAALGETDAALAALEQAVAVHDPRVIYIRHDANYRRLHRQPRFVALMKRLGLDGFDKGLTPV